jgi:hypothetical protein
MMDALEILFEEMHSNERLPVEVVDLVEVCYKMEAKS